MSPYQPAYVRLLESGELEKRAEDGQARLANCKLCPWACGVDRTANKQGVCHTGARARVAGWGAQHGEETCLSGTGGSGAVFFSRCNLRCVFCQNADISQADAGGEMDAEEIAQIFLSLQAEGCHNINLVTPSHVTAHILAALLIAARAGLRLPLVFNTGGYDALETLRLLDGVIDIYLPDMKFGDSAQARLLSGCKNYPAVNQAGVREMHRQVCELELDESGVARRGLIVRHLMLPANLAGTRTVMQFLASEVSIDTAVNLMDQYRPAYRAATIPAARRPITPEEFYKARLEAEKAGLKRWIQ